MTNDLKIDKILREYSPENEAEKGTGEKEENYTGSSVYDPERIRAIEESLMKRPPKSHRYSKFSVTDVGRPNVSYINSVTEVRKNTVDLPPKPTDAIEGYDGAVMTPQPEDEAYVPKVRKMSNSTRAKEMRENRRKKKKKKKLDFTYAVESPDGIYTKPEKKSKKFVIHRQADEQPLPKVDDGNIVPLSQQDDPDALDIKITEISSPTEIEEVHERLKSGHKKRKMQSREGNGEIKDLDSFEDAGKIKKAIIGMRDKISSRAMLMFIITLFSCLLAISGDLGLPLISIISPTESPRAFCWVQEVILLISIIVCGSSFKNGLLCLFTMRPDCDSIAALSASASFIATGAAAVLAPDMVKSGGIYIYAPLGVLSLFINAIGKRLILNRMAMNFDHISRSKGINGIMCVEDSDRAESLTRGTIGDFPILATMRKTNFLKDFTKYSYSADTGDRYSRVLSPIVLIFSVLLTALVAVFRIKTYDASAIAYLLCVFSASVCASSCIAIPLTANIPLHKAAKKYSRNQGIMLGYQSVEDFYDTNSVMVDAETFFPMGTIRVESVKLFSGTKVNDAFAEAASLAVRGGSVLKEIFSDMVTDRPEGLAMVENFVQEGSMGLCGWINNRRVLLGNRELMTNHKIEGLPTLTKEKEFTGGGLDALYLSVSGSLAAMFIIELSASNGMIKSMKQAEKHDIALIVRSVDPFITISKLSSLYGYPEDLIKIVPQRLMKDYEEETKRVRKLSASMACFGRFTAFIQLILGTKSIKKTVAAGIVIQLAAALLGFMLVGVNSVLNAFDNITPMIMLGYQVGATLLTAAIASFRKV